MPDMHEPNITAAILGSSEAYTGFMYECRAVRLTEHNMTQEIKKKAV